MAADCHYPYKPTDCCGRRKFWTAKQRAEYDASYPLRHKLDSGEFEAAAAAGNAAFGPRISGGTPGDV